MRHFLGFVDNTAINLIEDFILPARVCVHNEAVKVRQTQWMEATTEQKCFLKIYFSYISQPILYCHFDEQH